MDNKDKQHIEKLGLSQPVDYFATMQDKLLKRLKEDKSISDTQKKLGLEVPVDYFENSKQEVLSKISHQDVAIKPVYFRRNFWMAIAASIAILISFSIYLNQDQDSFQRNNNLTSNDFQQLDGEQMMLSSIFVQDHQFDLFLDEYMYENIVLESAVPIIDQDDITLETLFIDEASMDALANELLMDETIELIN